jgi:cysteine desulfurase
MQMQAKGKICYFDHAASTPLSPSVWEAMAPYFHSFYGNPSSIHQFGRKLKVALEKARRTIADLLNCAPTDIVFTSGGTEADNMVLRGVVEKYAIDHIISSPLEHHAVLHTLEAIQKRYPVQVHYLSVSQNGEIDIEELETLLKTFYGKKVLVSLMHVNNELGVLYDLHIIGHLCREYGAFFHSDTVQSLPYIQLNLLEAPVDYIVASAHKFYGPKGIGFLFQREGKGVAPLIHGGSQEREFRAGTENVAAIVGMAKALEETYANLSEQNAYLGELKTYVIEKIKHYFPDARFNGATDPEHSIPSTLNVSFPGSDQMLVYQLDLHGIAVSGGAACSSGSQKGSHVIEALNLPESYRNNVIRISFGKLNTKEEIDYFINCLLAIFNIEKETLV